MNFETPGGPRDFVIDHVTVAGWTGRDRDAVNHHIAELADIGVKPPSGVPLFYRVSAQLLTQDPVIQVLGQHTSGEVEPLVVQADGQLWLGLASDHTDRALETVSVAASKQICAKPIASELWPMSELDSDLDELELLCDIEEQGNWVRYQQGTLASIRPLGELIAAVRIGDGQAMLCGTLAAIGGVRPAGRYRMTLRHPRTDRSLSLDYAVTSLPEIA